MSAAGDDRALARGRRDPHEHGLEPERADPQADLIILGHAASGERLSILHGGELSERLASDRAAHSGQRDRGADRLAHHQFLDVRFGELVAIMAADPARIGVGQRQDWQLDHARTIDQPVENLELKGVNDILGIVEDGRLGELTGRGFEGDQRVVKLVEAIRFVVGPSASISTASIRGSPTLAIAAAVAGSLR